MSRPRKTMSDLARLANVNVSTVSRALNDSPLVKPETKREILRIAEDIGYSVNVAARNLRRQSSETLALVIPIRPDSGETISDPFFLEMVGAVSMAASERGYDLLVSTPRDETTIAERRLLQTGRADGLIIIGQAGRENRLQSIGALESKIIVWGGRQEGTDYTLVGSDNRLGGRLATQHLLDLGRRRILFVGDTDLPEIALRYDGYRQAHADTGVEIASDLQLKIGFGHAVKDVVPTLGSLLKKGLSMDGIFAASDALAMASIEALKQNGLDVPDDVSVVGYDNIAQAALSRPALTTVSQNIAQGGRLLVETLIRKLEGDRVGSQTTETKLIVRDSCGGRPT